MVLEHPPEAGLQHLSQDVDTVIDAAKLLEGGTGSRFAQNHVI